MWPARDLRIGDEKPTLVLDVRAAQTPPPIRRHWVPVSVRYRAVHSWAVKVQM